MSGIWFAIPFCLHICELRFYDYLPQLVAIFLIKLHFFQQYHEIAMMETVTI